MAEHEHYTDFGVYDCDGEKIGKVGNLFAGNVGDSEYIGVETDSISPDPILIPWELVGRVDDEHGRIEISEEREKVEAGPAFNLDKEITSEYEYEVRTYYGLDTVDDTADVRPGPGHG